MSDQATIEQSEECVLDRHGSCSGDMLAAATTMVRVRVPCRCICHGESE